jgi:hypothetical protein
MRSFAEYITFVQRMRIRQPNGKRVYVKPNRTQEDNIKLNYNKIV